MVTTTKGKTRIKVSRYILCKKIHIVKIPAIVNILFIQELFLNGNNFFRVDYAQNISFFLSEVGMQAHTSVVSGVNVNAS